MGHILLSTVQFQIFQTFNRLIGQCPAWMVFHTLIHNSWYHINYKSLKKPVTDVLAGYDCCKQKGFLDVISVSGEI